MHSNNQIVIYQSEDGQTQVDVRLENETVWLTQAQMVELFQTTKQNVSLHVGNQLAEETLFKRLNFLVCAEYLFLIFLQFLRYIPLSLR